MEASFIDLAEWRLASGRPADSSPVFPAHHGGLWSDLRHSFCSLLLAEGASVIEVARQAGHSPTMTLAVYGHVIDELAGGDSASAEAVIRAARDRAVPSTYPRDEARSR
jgi:integrase